MVAFAFFGTLWSAAAAQTYTPESPEVQKMVKKAVAYLEEAKGNGKHIVTIL